MRGRLQRYPEGKNGFTYPEMAFLLFVIALFLAGTVWVVNTAIVRSDPLGKSDRAGREAERALDRLEAMVKTGRVFGYSGRPPRSGSWTSEQGSLAFLGDLDGDPNTGSYRAMGRQGLEQVVVSKVDDTLVASVKPDPVSRPRVVVLLRDLSPADPDAFVSSFKRLEGAPVAVTIAAGGKVTAASGMVAGEIRISITTGLGGSRLVLGRSIGLSQKPVLVPAGQII